MRNIFLVLFLIFGSVYANAEITDAMYVKEFKKMWNACSTCYTLEHVEVYDVENKGGRWKKVTFLYSHNRSNKNYMAYMELAPRTPGIIFGAKFRCAVLNSQGNPISDSENCNWLK